MVRFKPVHKESMLLSVNFSQQMTPRSFEHALGYLVDHELCLNELHARYQNDE